MILSVRVKWVRAKEGGKNAGGSVNSVLVKKLCIVHNLFYSLNSADILNDL